jgi:hypothetical protein
MNEGVGKVLGFGLLGCRDNPATPLRWPGFESDRHDAQKFEKRKATSMIKIGFKCR